MGWVCWLPGKDSSGWSHIHQTNAFSQFKLMEFSVFPFLVRAVFFFSFDSKKLNSWSIIVDVNVGWSHILTKQTRSHFLSQWNFHNWSSPFWSEQVFFSIWIKVSELMEQNFWCEQEQKNTAIPLIGASQILIPCIIASHVCYGVNGAKVRFRFSLTFCFVTFSLALIF